MKNIYPKIPRANPYPSINTTPDNAYRKPIQHYTGTKLLGIATMHKSNAVPVFSSEQATDIARMGQ